MTTQEDPSERRNRRIYGPVVPTSKVYKETPVKPGQQHPVAKGGHYRLWHEHVWPHGYTPQRMDEVKNLDYEVEGDNDLLPGLDEASRKAREQGYVPDDSSTFQHSAPLRKHYQNVDRYARSVINRHLARSTIPIEHLKQIQRNKLGDKLVVSIRDELADNSNAATYSLTNHQIQLKVSESSTEVDEQRALTHEVGHAVDAATRPKEYVDEAIEERLNPNKYEYRSGNTAHPNLEGIAEGYSLGHSRVTRAGRRSGGNRAVGYIPSNWVNMQSTNEFLKARSKAFHEARGEPMEKPIQYDDQPDTTTQPGLFD